MKKIALMLCVILLLCLTCACTPTPNVTNETSPTVTEPAANGETSPGKLPDETIQTETQSSEQESYPDNTVMPTEPINESSKPATDSTEPATDSTEPPTDSTEPEVQPSQPTDPTVDEGEVGDNGTNIG